MGKYSDKTTIINEQLGAAYEAVTVPVADRGAPALRDSSSGQVFPVQKAPALPFDHTGSDTVSLIVLTLTPGQVLELEPYGQIPESPPAIQVRLQAGATVISNGKLSVRLPAGGVMEPPFDGPVTGIKMDGGEWFGAGRIVDAGCCGAICTAIESAGPCCAQWRTTCRWLSGGGVRYHMRWVAGSDTLLVDEHVFEDSSAALEWYPLGDTPARAYAFGGGEQDAPMRPIEYKKTGDAPRDTGRRRLGHISHIGYWNQWNYAWAGFSAPNDRRFAGVFSGWGGLWERRGRVRIEIHEDHERGHFLRFPLMCGRRLYGIVLSDVESSGQNADSGKCLLNRRKLQNSDLAPAKVMKWELDPPPESPKPRLIRQQDIGEFRRRIKTDPDVVSALREFIGKAPANHPGRGAAGLWDNDPAALRQVGSYVFQSTVKMLQDIAEGGYELLNIFEGRLIKRLAYDIDVLWSQGYLDETAYRRIRSIFLAVGGYMFTDPDFCRYGDFWPDREPAEGIAEALKDDMGDCPVPPNFASEFFSTTGVIAELFDNHPLHDEWQKFALGQTERFLQEFFETDGTYQESINYATHALNELACMMFPLWVNGSRDFFADPRVKGSFGATAELQTPPLSNGIRRLDGHTSGEETGSAGEVLYGNWRVPRAVLPNNGNSGGDGLQQEHRGELTFGAWVYRDSDPELAGHLMAAWQKAGKPIAFDTCPMLNLLTLDPSIPSREPPWGSIQRKGLGIVSKAGRPDTVPVWCLFRAGHATHHMDFDQGSVHLAVDDTVLLGDHGYSTHDTDDTSLPAASTALHNTVLYSDDAMMSNGYTGLEHAPEPALVHMGDDFDWCVHRIVNNNLRNLYELPYNVLLPVETTVHVRHYLFVKPDCFLLWDTFEQARSPSSLWLHPPDPMVEIRPGAYRTGERGRLGLHVQFLMPGPPQVIENRQQGPLWSFGIRNEPGASCMTLLVTQSADRGIDAFFDPDRRIVHISGTDIKHTIHLPAAGSTEALPVIESD